MMQNFSISSGMFFRYLKYMGSPPCKGYFTCQWSNLSAESIIIASRFLKNPENIVIITKDYKSSEEWMANLSSLVSEENIRFFLP